MKLLRSCDVVPDETGVVCRQSRWGGAVLAAVYIGLFVGLPVAAWWAGLPAPVWIAAAVLAVLLVPLFLGEVRARFRPTNWLLWIHPDRLWIHLRSYQDQCATDTLSVVELEYGEIAEAARRVERYSTPSAGSRHRSTRYKLESLELRLHQADGGALEAAVAENRRREQPLRAVLGFMRVRSKLTHSSVTLPAPDVIRIAWHGGRNHGARPSLSRALGRLGERVKIADPAADDSADWRDLSDDELDGLILELASRGNRIDAVKLLVRARGYSQTEAHRFVEELTRRA